MPSTIRRHVPLPLSRSGGGQGADRVKATLSFALRLMAFLLVPCTGFILLRYSIIALIPSMGSSPPRTPLDRTAGAPVPSLGTLRALAEYLTWVFYAHHDMRLREDQRHTVAVNIGLSYPFMRSSGWEGWPWGPPSP
jgi:hypothetical protein